MSLLNSKERRARDRGRKQGYQMCLDDITDYLLFGKAQEDGISVKDITKIMQRLEEMSLEKHLEESNNK